MNTITRVSDSADTQPILVLGYDTMRESRNVIHDLLDGSIAVTLINPRPRSGTLELLYQDADDAQAAMDLHTTSDTYELASSDRPSLDMTYVAGTVRLTLDAETRDVWVVAVEYQEIDL